MTAGVCRGDIGEVVTINVHSTVACVPLVVAFEPRQGGCEGCKEEVDGIRHDDVVVDDDEEHENQHGVANTCKIFTIMHLWR